MNHNNSRVENQKSCTDFNALKSMGNKGDLQKVIQKPGDDINYGKGWKNNAQGSGKSAEKAGLPVSGKGGAVNGNGAGGGLCNDGNSSFHHG